jgi:hypothetical protein
MKQRYNLSLFFIITLVSVIVPTFSIKAQLNQTVFVQILLENDKNKPWENLYFGVAPDATDGMDSVYNEYEIPDIPLPAGIFYAVMLTYSPTENKDIWSYRSIVGPSKDKDSLKFMREFRFKVFYGNGTYVRMSWQKLPKYLDSAIISDPYGAWFKVNMADKDSATNSEILVDQFNIYAYYNIDPNSVQVVQVKNSRIYPNPAKDFLIINSDDDIKSIEICNILDFKLLLHINYDNSPLNISNLENGTYFLKLINSEGKISVKKLVILR